MNDITNVQTLDDQLLAQAAPVLNPEKYSTAVFEPFRKQLAKAKRDVLKVPEYDITTTAGMAAAKQLRASFRDIRTSAENARKDRKAPIIQIGKLIDTKYKELEAEIEPLESKYDAQIKAEEARKAAEKARKEAEERARVEAIEARVANIRGVPAQMAGADSVAIRKQIEQWTLLRLDPADYQEYLESALTAVNTTLDQLGELLAAAESREAEARRVAEQLAELQRMKDEQAEREAKAAQEQAARDAQAKAERDAAAQREADMSAQMEVMRKQMEAMQAAVARAAQPEQIVTSPAEAGGGQGTIADVEADGTGLVVGQIVLNSGTVSTGDLPVMEVQAERSRAATVAQPRPGAGEIVEVLATHYGVSEDTVIGWLRADFNLS